jgi:energy-coupling factor transporter ATP-binding protein EcfA2
MPNGALVFVAAAAPVQVGLVEPQYRPLPAAEARRRIEHALEVTRLAALRDRLPAALSGGQQL